MYTAHEIFNKLYNSLTKQIGACKKRNVYELFTEKTVHCKKHTLAQLTNGVRHNSEVVTLTHFVPL